jgi:hypothetical protein
MISVDFQYIRSYKITGWTVSLFCGIIAAEKLPGICEISAGCVRSAGNGIFARYLHVAKYQNMFQ